MMESFLRLKDLGECKPRLICLLAIGEIPIGSGRAVYGRIVTCQLWANQWRVSMLVFHSEWIWGAFLYVCPESHLFIFSHDKGIGGLAPRQITGNLTVTTVGELLRQSYHIPRKVLQFPTFSWYWGTGSWSTLSLLPTAIAIKGD